MDRARLQTQAQLLRQLHKPGQPLVLPNAWDVMSARLVEDAGFPAVATSSAGIAAALGYVDGEQIPRERMLDMVWRIARAVRVPVTADLEAGYGAPGETVRAALDAGAVGMNLEDGAEDAQNPLASIDEQSARIRSAREVAERQGVSFVLNARVDVYLREVGPAETRFDRAVERARAYLAAGADCVFIPGVRDAKTLGALVQAVPGPLNVLAVPGTPPIEELARLGVARVSFGSGPARLAYGVARKLMHEIRGAGTFAVLGPDALTSGEVKALLSRGPGKGA